MEKRCACPKKISSIRENNVCPTKTYICRFCNAQHVVAASPSKPSTFQQDRRRSSGELPTKESFGGDINITLAHSPRCNSKNRGGFNQSRRRNSYDVIEEECDREEDLVPEKCFVCKGQTDLRNININQCRSPQCESKNRGGVYQSRRRGSNDVTEEERDRVEFGTEKCRVCNGPSKAQTNLRNINMNQCRSPQCESKNRGGVYQSRRRDSHDVIEEEPDREDLETERCHDCNGSSSSSSSESEADPVSLFFDALQDAVKNSVESTCGRYFAAVLGKLDKLSKQLEATDHKMTKFYQNLNDKIVFYGDRSTQQFQYLGLRLEHDHLFYQQQQEYFLNQQNRPGYNPMKGSENEQNQMRSGAQYNDKAPGRAESEPAVAARRCSGGRCSGDFRNSLQERPPSEHMVYARRCSSEVNQTVKGPENAQTQPFVQQPIIEPTPVWVPPKRRSSEGKIKDSAPENQNDQGAASKPRSKSQEQIGDQSKSENRRKSIEILEPVKRPSQDK